MKGQFIYLFNLIYDCKTHHGYPSEIVLSTEWLIVTWAVGKNINRIHRHSWTTAWGNNPGLFWGQQF